MAEVLRVPHRRSNGLVAVLALSMAAVTAVALMSSRGGKGAPSAFPGNSGRIAYNVAASGRSAWIATISPDGTRVRRLVSGRSEAFSPSWSADGRRIVFVMAGAVWRVNGDGQQLKRVTRRGIVDPESPGWSPDGRRVVFAARTSGHNFDIYVCNVDGSALRRLTKSSSPDEHPSWSPKSGQIIFSRTPLLTRDFPASAELWLMNADGRRPRRIGVGSSPDWAPGGKRIAFTRGDQIWVANASGGNAVLLIGGPGMAGDPAWSPDGRWIVFWSDRASDESTKGDLYLASADGELVQRLTFEPALWHFAPSWQPTAKRVATPKDR
jgi:TolB protein